MADCAAAKLADLDGVFTDLVRVETRLYNAVAVRVKTGPALQPGTSNYCAMSATTRTRASRNLASAFAIGVGTTSKIADRLEREGWLTRRPNRTNRR